MAELNRRDLLAGTAAAVTAAAVQFPSAAQSPADFDRLLDAALADSGQVEASREEREGFAQIFQEAGRGVAPRLAPSAVPVGDRATRLIIGFEVSGRQRYEQKYQGPVWPKGKSGVTIGIGYDVGYVSRAYLAEDWAGVLSTEEIARLGAACGVSGWRAATLLTQVRPLTIPWAAAYNQFTTTALPRYVALTLRSLPNANLLPQDCLGALVSLVYNRGPGFQLRSADSIDRYREMRAIRLHMVRKELDLIPDELLSMRRIWKKDSDVGKGLQQRRELEAALFRQGLKARQA